MESESEIDDVVEAGRMLADRIDKLSSLIRTDSYTIATLKAMVDSYAANKTLRVYVKAVNADGRQSVRDPFSGCVAIDFTDEDSNLALGVIQSTLTLLENRLSTSKLMLTSILSLNTK